VEPAGESVGTAVSPRGQPWFAEPYEGALKCVLLDKNQLFYLSNIRQFLQRCLILTIKGFLRREGG
jgi:hypothetical protein